MNFLIINSGSSSVRFAVYEKQPTPLLRLAGKVDRINDKDFHFNAQLQLTQTDGGVITPQTSLKTGESIAVQLIHWLECQPIFVSVKAVGHRMVHGMNHTDPQLITPLLLEQLHNSVAFAPQHMPQALEFIHLLHQRQPDLPQVACFDTSFHQTMPAAARQLPLPRDEAQLELRRYGFHGLSCESMVQQLHQLNDPVVCNGRVILAHLGSGASLTALKDGKSLDNSMGFTPAGGLMMGTRSGDLDPGVMIYLMATKQLNTQQLDVLINQCSGLLGVSGLSSDLRDLLEQASQNAKAAEAIALFCYQVTKWIGSFSAVLGGLDTLVFTGGVGENLSIIRAKICHDFWSNE